jgi:ribosomal protein S20
MTFTKATRLLLAITALALAASLPAIAQETEQEAPPAMEAPGQSALGQLLGEAIQAIEQADRATAEQALQQVLTTLDEAPADAVVEGEAGQQDQLRTLIEAALDALENEDFAGAQQTVQEAEQMATRQQASVPVLREA